MIPHVLGAACAALLAVSVGATDPAPVASAPKEATRSSAQSIFEGDWENRFGASLLVFRFRPENGVLAGWFVSTKNGQSYPLRDVRAKGKTLSFVYPSKPELVFTVTAQKGGDVLSGVSSRPDGEAMPQTLTRRKVDG